MRSKLLGVLAGTMLIGFVYALMRIAILPLESGDAYPEYSSLRADPRGTKALYESLAVLSELSVSRNFQPLPKLKGSQAVVLLLGERAWTANTWGEEQLKFYESLAAEGARLVIGFLPEAPESALRRHGTPSVGVPALTKRWHLKVNFYKGTIKEVEAAGSMPRETNAFFTFEGDSDWEVLDANEGDDATLISHSFGKGAVLLLTESYPLSNEGLRAERDVALIDILAGPRQQFVFDETHLGVENTGSVGALIRRYRLTGAFGVAVLLGLLFLWKNSTSLLPQADDPPSATAQGADAQSGLVNLLKRSVQPSELARACWDRWKDTRALGRPVSDQRVQQAERELDAGGRPIDIYRKIQHILTEKT